MFDLVNLPPNEIKIIIENTASKMDISNAIIEKDLWVSTLLYYLFSLSPWKNHLIFKGGTSLSKAFNIIQRFSEDIDLILDWRLLGYGKNEPYENRSNTQQDKFNKQLTIRMSEYLKKTILPELSRDLSSLINHKLLISIEDDVVIINYGSQYKDKSILQTIRLEIGPLAAWMPSRKISITPYISDAYPKIFNNTSVKVNTITPERTFWEKTTILHREAFRSEASQMPQRMSRHYYDLYQISKSPYYEQALNQSNLLDEVASFKKKFYPQTWAHYDLAKIGTLKLYPPEYALNSLKRDYEKMKNMFFDKYPNYNTLMKNILKIEKDINSIQNIKEL